MARKREKGREQKEKEGRRVVKNSREGREDYKEIQELFKEKGRKRWTEKERKQKDICTEAIV